MITRGQSGGQQVRGSGVAGRAMRWSAGIAGLFVVVLLGAGTVVGIGLRSAEPPPPVYSAAEQAQLDAEGRYRALAAGARTAAALDPAVAERLAAVASDLEVQADAVALPRSPGPSPEATAPGSATSGGATPSDATSAGSTPPQPAASGATPPASDMNGPRVLSMLRDSALRSLRDAVDADPGPARVLASAGANQWRQAVLLAQALGSEPGLPPADTLSATDLAADDAEPAAPADPASEPAPAPQPAPASPAPAPEDCAGTPAGTEADRQALLDAKQAEDQARYGYEVAAALLPDPAALARSAVHEAAADTAAGRLAELCVPAAPVPAGFALAPVFRADPVAALRELEQDHAELYADLVSTVGPGLRAWAVAGYNAAAQRSLDAGTPLDAFPGLHSGSPHGPSTPEATDAPAETPDAAGPSDG